jgi:sodium transport system ATP-binding protein
MLQAQSLTKEFDGRVAVEDVSFTVAPGEIMGLIGPNGAGKTTTLRMLAGILPPSSGRVIAGGMDVAARPLEAKRRIGFLSGTTQLYGRLSVVEVLRFFGHLYGLEGADLKERIGRVVEDLHMESFANQRCGTLSSGQRQRANLARAFLHEPDILILDEPTATLDVITGRFVVEFIRQERARGKAVIFSTHVMGEVEHLCDRIAVIYRGRLAAVDSPRSILQSTRTVDLTDAFFALTGAAEEAR